jgi:hypothetical protein
VDDSVHAGIRYQFVSEEAMPVGYRQLTCYDKRFAVISVIKYLFEVILLLTIQRSHAEVVDDEQVQMFHFLEELEFMTFKTS